MIPTTGVHGAINLAITCAGTLPTGACCDPYLTECRGGPDDAKRCPANSLCVGGTDEGEDCSPSKPCASPGVCTPYCAGESTCEAVCRETTELNCPFPPRGQDLRPTWQSGEACQPDPFGNNPCGVAACCHKGRRNPDDPDVLIEVCDNFTKSECESAPSLDEPRVWQIGKYCGLDTQTCAHDCISADGSCYVAHDTPGCSNPYCCSKVCSHDSFCCNTAWDSGCVTLAEYYCAQHFNDQCAPLYPNPNSEGALMIRVPGSAVTSNVNETTDPGEPGFCCNAGTGTCIGGTNDGAKCVVGTDCNSGVCTERVPEPWAQAFGTVWFKFVQPQGLTTAGISTCNSPALDSVVQVFAATDYSSQLAACNSLIPIGCNDDTLNCGSTGRNSRLCLRNLTPGDTYYIELAAKTENRLGQYIVTISTSCTGETQPCTNCPVGEMAFVDPPNNVVDARRPYPPNNPQSSEGIKTIVVKGPFWATKDCWSVCESPAVPASIQIARVDEAPPGTYTVQLNQTIAPGAVTMLTYTDSESDKTVGRLIAHPANVDGDSQANAFDILDLIDHLNGIKTLPWGQYSGDLDHSGIIGPTDILTLIDLLNGTNGFAEWYGTALPVGNDCP